MLDFLHKYQEELFEDKRLLDHKIKVLDGRLLELDALSKDISSKEDQILELMTPFDSTLNNRSELEKINKEETSVRNQLEELRLNRETIKERIVKVQDLLISMSDWKFDQVSPSIDKEESLIIDTESETAPGKCKEQDYCEVADSNNSIDNIILLLEDAYVNIDFEPEKCKKMIRQCIRFLMEENTKS